MKNYVKRILIYYCLGIIFTIAIVIMYDGGLSYTDIILESALLFALISLGMEKIMMVVYTKISIPSLLRQVFTIVIGTGLYSFVAFVAKPWSITKFLFRLPAFFFAVLPTFIVFAIIFEYRFKHQLKICNERLERIKNIGIDDSSDQSILVGGTGQETKTGRA